MIDTRNDLAIVGLSARFSQEATDVEKFWDFLLKARQSSTPFPKDRINMDGYYHPDRDRKGALVTKGAHFLKEDPKAFDAAFFRVGKSEVLSLDPQQRILMENVYHALENAGVPMENVVSSNTSVYVSGFNHDSSAASQFDTERCLKHRSTGTQNSVISGRVSWFFDLKGPSMTVDTACSTSMVALHLACQGLKNGESDMAIVSGLNLIGFTAEFLAMSHSGFLGKEGKCFTFDHRADGYARGEGVGTLIVKRLSTALEDGDTIRAVIRGTWLNQDGNTPGIAVPNGDSQEALVHKTYLNAGLDPASTLYVESHGTGTPTGDPIEAKAIANAFQSRSRKRDGPLIVGSLKPNIGHLEGGAGIAAVIKGVMILESGIIPPNVNFEKVNPRIPVEKLNLTFPTRCIPWPKESGTRRISIDGFGLSGTNGHCILDDAYSYLAAKGLQGTHNTRINIPSQQEIDLQLAALQSNDEPITEDKESSTKSSSENPVLNGQHTENNHDSRALVSTESTVITNGHGLNGHHASGINGHAVPQPSRLFLLSSHDKDGWKRYVPVLQKYIQQKLSEGISEPQEFLDSLTYTLAYRRSRMRWKTFIVANSLRDLEKKLVADKINSYPCNTKNVPRVGFIFTGQGAQYHNMGKQLMEYDVFRRSLEDATEYMQSLGSSWSLLDELRKDESLTQVHHPSVAHPACAAIQIALVDLLYSWNIYPSRVIGHSSGEIAAAYCAGKVSREGAWKVAYFRGYMSAWKSRKGSMVAVGMESPALQVHIDQVKERLPGVLSIACYNSPNNQTVSGDEALVDELIKDLSKHDVFTRKLNVQRAYHSKFMEESATQYLTALAELPPGSGPQYGYLVKMFSSVTGQLQPDTALDAAYWAANMTSPVRFSSALEQMCFDAGSSFVPDSFQTQPNSSHGRWLDYVIEIGPHSALKSAVKETLRADPDIKYLPSLIRTSESADGLLSVAATLNTEMVPVDIQTVNQCTQRKRTTPHLLVDLPPYVFYHGDSSWEENRLYKRARLRQYPRHDLFGAPVADWDPENPKWRHFLRVSENPWLQDHKINNDCVFPGVGYLVMAIEASKQISDRSRCLKGFELKDVSLKTMLVIPDDADGIEVSLTLSPVDESIQWVSSTWRKFRITSYDVQLDSWTLNCTGYIALQYEEPTNIVDDGRNSREDAESWQKGWEEISSIAIIPQDSEKIYAEMKTQGYNFGPFFRNLSHVQTSNSARGTKAVGTVTVPDIESVMPSRHMHPHLIHPTTLDSMLHVGLHAIRGFATEQRLSVPTFFKSVWVSANISNVTGSSFACKGSASEAAHGVYDYSIQAWDSTTAKGVISIDNGQMRPIQSTSADKKLPPQTCFKLDWTPSVQYLTFEGLKKWSHYSESASERQKIGDMYSSLQLTATLLATDALAALNSYPVDTLPGHHEKLYDSLKNIAAGVLMGSISFAPFEKWQKYTSDPVMKENLYRDAANSSARGALLVRVASEIPSILKQTTDPLFLMFGQDDLMDRYYDEALQGPGTDLARHYVSLLKDQTKGLKVLEIGAGTGSFTQTMLTWLSPRVSEYVYTDISPSFFSKGKERLAKWESILKFQKLDIEIEPRLQGFDMSDFDIVIAYDVLHATSDLHKTLTNVHSLLKPGGKLILHEGYGGDMLFTNMVFGVLPGWWLGKEPCRKWSAFISPSEWHRCLQEASFSGVDVEIPLVDVPEINTHSFMVSTSVAGPSSFSTPQKILILSDDKASNAVELQERLINSLPDVDCSIHALSEVSELELQDSVCISLIELETPLLHDIGPDELQWIKLLLTTCMRVIWVTGNSDENPLFGMSTGLIRSVRSERKSEGVDLTILAQDASNKNGILEPLRQIITTHFFSSGANNENAEYAFKNGIIEVRQIDENEDGSRHVRGGSSESAEMIAWSEIKWPMALSIGTPGTLSGLAWIPDAVVEEPLDTRQVEMTSYAVGLNFKDLLAKMGEVFQDNLGSEGAGIVTRIGSGVTGLKPGDRVFYLGDLGGTFRSKVRADERFVTKIPEDLGFDIAGGLPVVYCTVIHALRDVGRLMPGEKILIHAASGGVGQAAIQYAQLIGAEIFATVSSKEKMQFLIERYGIEPSHILSSRDLTFPRTLMRMTPKGVDLVLNSLSGEALRQTWDCLAPFGRFIEIGKRDLLAGGRISMEPFLRNATFSGVDLVVLSRERPDAIRDLLESIVDLWEKKQIREVLPTTVLALGQLEEGLRKLQLGKNIGKIVLVPDDNDRLPAVRPPPSFFFDSTCSYVLAGGLGGIGRSLARWMASRGARNLIFLSRSVRNQSAVDEMKSELGIHGCKAHIVLCDVSDEHELGSAIQKCGQELPPIRGCIQAAFFLKDGLFELMTHENWHAPLAPKVRGTWNLHQSLPQDMDFFIMLSSMAGITGFRGQSNYNAGNTFQDCLASYRRHKGQRATSINLGPVREIGYMSENLGLFKNIHETPHTEKDVHALVEYALLAQDQSRGQIACNIFNESMYRQLGLQRERYLDYPMFRRLSSPLSSTTSESLSKDSGNVASLLGAAQTREDALSIVIMAVQQKLANILNVSEDQIDLNISLRSNGVDSLVEMEFRTWLARDFGASIPLPEMSAQSLSDLCGKVLSLTKLAQFEG